METCKETQMKFKMEADPILKKLIKSMVRCSEKDRIEMINELTSKYCEHCGIILNGQTCYCNNDE